MVYRKKQYLTSAFALLLSIVLLAACGSSNGDISSNSGSSGSGSGLDGTFERIDYTHPDGGVNVDGWTFSGQNVTTYTHFVHTDGEIEVGHTQSGTFTLTGETMLIEWDNGSDGRITSLTLDGDILTFPGMSGDLIYTRKH